MAPPTPLCADTARERGDAMQGTALHLRRFLLVEHPGPWAFDALGESGIDPAVLGSLLAATRDVGGRTLLIRRHGRVDDTGERAWAVADVVEGRIRWGTWSDDADLLAARDALGEDSAGWTDEPVLLVCTHGRHDTCCAVRGRPVAAALAERHGDRVWECSHVGGDRFAASVVVLPDGTYYGGLERLRRCRRPRPASRRHRDAGESARVEPAAHGGAGRGGRRARTVRSRRGPRRPLGDRRDPRVGSVAGRAVVRRSVARAGRGHGRSAPFSARRPHLSCSSGDVGPHLHGHRATGRLTLASRARARWLNTRISRL